MLVSAPSSSQSTVLAFKYKESRLLPAAKVMHTKTLTSNCRHKVSWKITESPLQRIVPLHDAFVRRGRYNLVLPFGEPECRTSSFKRQMIRESSSRSACIASLPTSRPSSVVKPSPMSSGKHLRRFGFDFPLNQREFPQAHGHNSYSWMIELCGQRLTYLEEIFSSIEARILKTIKRKCEHRSLQGRKVLLTLVVAMICLTCPGFTLTNDISISIANDVALAQPFGQIRQAALFLERIGGSTPSKVLDKVMTVISGQTVVTPENVDKLKSMIEGEKESKDWQTDFASNAQTLWSTTVDVVSQFDPFSLIEATGNGIQGLVEGAAERFAAFELSTLVALGERWILWAPFVIFPMYWQMTKNQKDKEITGSTRGYVQGMTVEGSEGAAAKAARVRDELERIELKASLMESVYSFGKLALQADGNDQNTKRRQIEDILTRLLDLSPTSSIDRGGAFVKAPSSEAPYSQHFMDVDGEWRLIYISQDFSQGEKMQFVQLLNLNVPGLEISNLQQKLWRQGLKAALLATEIDAERLEAKNTAQIRLGPLGVVELSMQGSWEHQKDGKSSVMSFQSMSAKPLELLGSRVRDDVPPLNFSLPVALQASREWKTVYLDNSLRINRAKTGQLFLFQKMG